MALETVVFPQDPFTCGYCNNDYFSSSTSSGGAWSNNTNNNNYGLLQAVSEEEETLLQIINNNNNMDQEQNLHSNNWDSSSNSVVLHQNVKEQWDSHSSSPEACNQSPAAPFSSRRKRRRTKSTKNREDIENQRMTHIAVERNRRKQMNEYLSVLRSLMPSSYIQRGDQASIIGGTINFVKELEHVLQSMEGQKRMNQSSLPPPLPPPFAEFFTFPQYTTCAATQSNDTAVVAVADIEVTLVDSHANLKILSKERAGQLMKIVVGLQSLSLTVLHLNVTTVDDLVLYSVSLKVEEGCELTTVDEIAAAVNQLLRTVGEEIGFQINATS